MYNRKTDPDSPEYIGHGAGGTTGADIGGYMSTETPTQIPQQCILHQYQVGPQGKHRQIVEFVFSVRIEGCEMKGERKVVRGSVKIVACGSCDAKLPLFAFEAETDTESVGLCSAAKCNGIDLMIAETTIEEWREVQSGRSSRLPPRLIGSSDIDDFYIMRIKRVESSPTPGSGIPFSEFKKLYKAPVVIYECPCCLDGEAVEIDEMIVPKFTEMGGRIVALGSLVVESAVFHHGDSVGSR